ncbi:MAG TPA: carboxypeptidase-like regulatory domain-containing protein [Nitrospiria bacterium]|nr:carboxypeptidase-like regulatory domain-containing protein [Nitrospiria bacterium]
MKRFMPIFMVVLLSMIIAPWAASGSDYKSEKVIDGGSISGKVTLRGPIPPPRAFPIVLYAFGEFCKKISDGSGHVLLREFNVDSDGGFQDVIVAVQGVKKGKPFSYIKNEYIAVNCMFHPYDVPENEQFEMHHGKLSHVHPLVTVMRNHRVISVVNRDPVLHNGQIYQPERGNRVLNFSIPISQDVRGGYVHMQKGMHIAQMICGMHEYMQAWAWMVDNPYYAKTRKGGNFTIDDLPPGTYKVIAWHPHMDPIEKVVTVPRNGSVSLDFEFDAREVIRPVYETQDQFRIGPGYRPEEDLMGCEGPYCVHKNDN